MKKIFSIIIAFILVIGMCSCSAKEPKSFEVLYAGGSDGGISSKQELDIELSLPTEYEDIDRFIEYTVNGITYKLIYGGTNMDYRYNRNVRKYYTQDFTQADGVEGELNLGISKETGEFLELYHDYDYKSANPNTEIKSKEECRSIADEFFSERINDKESYTVTESSLRELPEVDFYKFEYVQYIDEIQTESRAYISVNVYGQIFEYNFLSPNAIELNKVTLPNDKMMDEILVAVNDKVDQCFDRSIIANLTITDINEYEKSFIRLSDGTYALSFDVNVNVEYTSGSILEELIRVIVKLEY